MSSIMGDYKSSAQKIIERNKPKTEEQPATETFRVNQEVQRTESKKILVQDKKSDSKAKTSKKDKPKGKKEYYRINLALSQELGETIKAMADAEERSVNNYIERILKDHIERR